MSPHKYYLNNRMKLNVLIEISLEIANNVAVKFKSK